jgi:hypothetical protein
MTQANMILKHMQQGHSLTALEALNRFGCNRLAARICDLRQSGHVIHTDTVSANGKQFAKYSLVRSAA